MAERKAVNKYYPPDWDPKKGSVNKHVGQHPLRERARKLDQGILIIRFEMPFNIWCGGCEAHIGMGVRYNAEKKRIGSYFSTPVYSFRMKCHLCSHWIEIHTDPKTAQYLVVAGARRKEERWDMSTNGTLQFKSEREAEQLALNPFFKLDHDVADAQRGAQSHAQLVALKEAQDRLYKDDYGSSRLARSVLRAEKSSHAVRVKEADRLREKFSINIPFVPEREEDVEKARRVAFKGSSGRAPADSTTLAPAELAVVLKRRKIMK